MDVKKLLSQEVICIQNMRKHGDSVDKIAHVMGLSNDVVWQALEADAYRIESAECKR